ncbi:GNAT family N-acetyltransferase [Streptomyces sp. NPDC002779]|uniref:GNAT family N-acetyltransferase n=1 Tax=Streptomyces sp. NPDC002779 TaxID=3364664 RepID=UPI00368A1F1D
MELTLRPVAPAADAELLHVWVTHPKAAFWLMQEADVAEVREAYEEIAADPYHHACLGLRDGTPAFLAERYDPAHRELADAYQARPGDVGMHFLMAPTDTPVHGFTQAVLTTVMEWLFADPSVHRVVVEPDVRNTAVLRLNEAIGFAPDREIRLPRKTALLSFCTRDSFRAARGALT